MDNEFDKDSLASNNVDEDEKAPSIEHIHSIDNSSHSTSDLEKDFVAIDPMDFVDDQQVNPLAIHRS